MPFANRMNHHTRRVTRSAAPVAAALLLAVAACSNPPGILPGDADEALLLEDGSVFRMQVAPGLEQTVELENRRLHPGDDLRLRSVVRNIGDRPQKAEALVCQLEVRTNLDWEPIEPLIMCLAYSAQVELAPNDSLVLTAAGKIKSRPGHYSMVVRHLLRPDIRARVRINVHPNP